MGIPLIVIGIILGVIHPVWFHSQDAVSTVLIWVGIVLTVIPFLFFGGLVALIAWLQDKV